MRLRALPLLVALAPSAAWAGWPEDVTISGMTSYGGIDDLDTASLSESYRTVVKELAVSVASSTIPAPATLGSRGFEIVLDSGFTFLDTRTSGEPSPWGRAVVDEDPTFLQGTPGLTVRKGLPLSLELGLTGRWVSLSRQGVFGGFARVGIVEGWKPFPDLSLRVGYTGYVGNDELELGVADIGLTLGSTFPVGGEGKLKSVKVSPYLDVALLVVNATPLVSDEVVTQVGAVTFGGASNNPEALPAEGALVLPRFSGGLELRFARLVFRLSGGYALGATGNAAAAIGFTY